MGSLASTGCQVPGFRCTFAHAHGLWEGKETAKTWKREGSGWGEKGSRRADTPKEQSQLHLVSLRGTETQGRIPALGPGGPTGYICSRLGGHRGQCRFFSGGDPPALGKEKPRGQWRPSRGTLGEDTDHRFLPALQSCPEAGRRECGKWATGEGGWFCSEMLLRGKWAPQASTAPASSRLWIRG